MILRKNKKKEVLNNNLLKERNASLVKQNSVLEKRLLATEVELLRKIVALYEEKEII